MEIRGEQRGHDCRNESHDRAHAEDVEGRGCGGRGDPGSATRAVALEFPPASDPPDDDTTVLLADAEDVYTGWTEGGEWFDCTGRVVPGGWRGHICRTLASAFRNQALKIMEACGGSQKLHKCRDNRDGRGHHGSEPDGDAKLHLAHFGPKVLDVLFELDSDIHEVLLCGEILQGGFLGFAELHHERLGLDLGESRSLHGFDEFVGIEHGLYLRFEDISRAHGCQGMTKAMGL